MDAGPAVESSEQHLYSDYAILQHAHPAMFVLAGLYRFEKRFAERTYDVGIAEQHAVTFAAGLACEGIVPFCTIYSTFLQRGYDQVVHDVALQKLPGRCGGMLKQQASSSGEGSSGGCFSVCRVIM